ncbi:Vi polysaccharide biosynthesis UDP-N-acetylglucosamine C-6 dehydrogenase TviB [Campylobacter sp. RM16187]|uniref:Vi polysaccharide biosynthesis UDP-N-acetylglucosamine C-6 dehydrogenase TviB n=1 Tax=Campylobacter sp. RM16187 TaxID=1660063 RepID=UPI0021B5361F|nr:Vi polysaccharide biosynthesis UDP-N-acetylglucosamine C-6 dehydrogenase TviB [Campylobacter sp. RM16187]QKG29846.1 polysaccharide biosynthesis protein, nucleotide sugar dehydrogenase, TviB family [Campylobacter sp. RM16187]
MKIAVIGLGYVGLPLAAAFSKKYEVVGFDVNNTRIEELKRGFDRTLELNSEQMSEAIKNSMKFSTNLEDIKDCSFFIVTVPTPIDKNKRPDLTPVIKASESVAKVLKKGDIVVYESTVYPGVTEEICVPILERVSQMKFNQDFYCGYSPERINPGDKEHTVTKIKKITSGSTPQIADKVDEVYRSIITAGTHKAPSIKVAEAAKVIENTQRDINIAFINELAMIFERMNIDTSAVLEAAGTKWNFLNFRPGLVGGHCIGVDPYYLTHKAQELGFHPEMILAGRRINDNMGKYAASQVIKLMIKKGVTISSAKVLVLGLTFKENCPDIRNSRVIDVIEELKDFGCKVDVYDPWVDEAEVKREYGITPLKNYDENDYNCVIIAVAHDKFKGLKFKNILVYDIKNIYPDADARL